MTLYHGRRDLCVICGARYMHPKELIAHMEMHTVVECEVCGEKFFSDAPGPPKLEKKGSNQLSPQTSQQKTTASGGSSKCKKCAKNKEAAKPAAAAPTSVEKKKVAVETTKDESVYRCQLCYETETGLFSMIMHRGSHSIEGQHACCLCNERFNTFADFCQHITTHKDEKLLRCQHCHRAFTEKKSTGDEMCSTSSSSCTNCRKMSDIQHHKEVAGLKGLSDDRCGDLIRIFTGQSDLAKSRDDHPDVVFHECCACKMQYNDFEKMKAHWVAAHKSGSQCILCEMVSDHDVPNAHVSTENEGRIPVTLCSPCYEKALELFQCTKINGVCSRRTSSSEQDRRHVTAVHRWLVRVLCLLCMTPAESNRMNAQITVGGNILENVEVKICKQCKPEVVRIHYRKTIDDAVNATAGLDPHSASGSTWITPHECGTCKKKFSLMGNLKKHLAEHKFAVFKCHFCKQNLSRKEIGQVKVSRCIEGDGNRIIACVNCVKAGRSFEAVGRLAFKCDICSESFHSADSLESHKATKHGPTPYKCEYCEKKLRYYNDVLKHQSFHETATGFKCHICNKEFLIAYYLRLHVRKHNEEESTPIADQKQLPSTSSSMS